jgi:hypothetical protein
VFLKFYCSCNAPVFLLYIVCSCNLIIYPYFRLNLLFFSFLIIPYIFNITRSFILYYYLIDYLKYIPDKNLYNRLFLLGKIILLFILFIYLFILFSFVISNIGFFFFPSLPFLFFFFLSLLYPPLYMLFVFLASRPLMLAILILYCQGLPSYCFLL